VSDYELSKIAAYHRQDLLREAEKEHLVQQAVSQRRLINHDVEHHHEHLCQLVETRQMETVASLVGDAKFICAHCGRVAGNPGNLCDPVERSASS
jgi:hypothetical protein